MKIKDLIKELSEYDPETEVYVDGSAATWGYGRAAEVYVSTEDAAGCVVVIQAWDGDEEKEEKR